MTKRSGLKPRKTPMQHRSRATVDAILQAATYILVKRGWKALTTNAIAERAGVNIASLYQFFPNKDAVVAELERRHAEETRMRVAEIYARHRGEDMASRTRTMVEAFVAAHTVAPELHRAFADELPKGRRDPAEPFIVDGGRAELAALGLPHPDLAAWIVYTVAHAVVHDGMTARKSDIESGALVDELVTLIVRYVARPEKKRRPR